MNYLCSTENRKWTFYSFFAPYIHANYVPVLPSLSRKDDHGSERDICRHSYCLFLNLYLSIYLFITMNYVCFSADTILFISVQLSQLICFSVYIFPFSCLSPLLLCIFLYFLIHIFPSISLSPRIMFVSLSIPFYISAQLSQSVSLSTFFHLALSPLFQSIFRYT